MTVRDTPWPDGTPCWAELAVPDLELGRQFYGALLGWEFEVGPEETGFSSEALVGGRRAAALNGYRPDPDAPVAWLPHLATADVAAAADRATAAGATVLAGPMDVMAFGAMAVLADPTGAPVALWQAGTSIGAQVVDEPGAIAWAEHMSADPAAARAFYPAVFDYVLQDISQPGFDYTTLLLADEPVGGIGGGWDRPEWCLYVRVEDTDAVVAAATRLGGGVHLPAEDSPYGRVASITGPFGERLGLMGPNVGEAAAAQG
ncbi:VOC family protein [Cellulomonas pakistanensis]|nr:VOC family protein [Cellulomonas pakistanensis]